MTGNKIYQIQILRVTERRVVFLEREKKEVWIRAFGQQDTALATVEKQVYPPPRAIQAQCAFWEMLGEEERQGLSFQFQFSPGWFPNVTVPVITPKNQNKTARPDP